MSKQLNEPSLVSTDVEALGEPRESEVVVKEEGKNKWVIYIDGKSQEIIAGETFADKKSAEVFAEKKYGVLPKVQRIKKKTKKKAPKKNATKVTKKAAPSKRTPQKKPLTLHKHFLVDLRRHIPELQWTEGDKLRTAVRTKRGKKVLEIALLAD